MIITLAGCALFNAADQEIIRLDDIHDRHVAEKMNAMGIHWLETGDVEFAKRAFEKALIADETYGPAHNNLGQIFYDAGDMYQAALAFDTAARYLHGDPVTFNNLGLALESGGKLLEAMEQYQRAYELDPSQEEFLGNLVRARMRLGEWDESLMIQLRELRYIETRPEWIEWIDEQLAIRFNPYLDRGPGGPELSPLQPINRDKTTPGDQPATTPPPGDGPPDSSFDGPPMPPPGFPALPPFPGEAPGEEIGRATLE